MFYDRFAELCAQKDVTPAKVAESIGVNKSTMYMWKKQGTTPKYGTLQKLANYFDVPVDDLLGLTLQDQAELQYIEDYVVAQTGREREEVRESILDDMILEMPNETFNIAVSKSDYLVVDAFKNVPDGQLERYILQDFESLNRRGRIEAAMRIFELVTDCRFSRRAGHFPEDPQPTPAQEDNDTTPTEDAPETPPVGK